jgi:Putative inner membrane protein (DUF1819)
MHETTLRMRIQPDYNLSFTAASLRIELARIIAGLYVELGSWSAVKTRVLESNALQSRNARSAVRMERELRQRLEKLTHDQLMLLATGNADDRAAMAWLSAQKKIPFAYDFVAEVLREKLANHDPILRLSDYEAFLETKSFVHKELTRTSPTSKRKIRQVLLLMLTEAGLLTDGRDLGMIQRPVLSAQVTRSIVVDSPHWLAGFLLSSSEIQESIIHNT